MIRGWAGAESYERAANSRRDDEQRSGEDKGAEDEEEKLVHELMILQSEWNSA